MTAGSARGHQLLHAAEGLRGDRGEGQRHLLRTGHGIGDGDRLGAEPIAVARLTRPDGDFTGCGITGNPLLHYCRSSDDLILNGQSAFRRGSQQREIGGHLRTGIGKDQRLRGDRDGRQRGGRAEYTDLIICGIGSGQAYSGNAYLLVVADIRIDEGELRRFDGDIVVRQYGQQGQATGIALRGGGTVIDLILRCETAPQRQGTRQDGRHCGRRVIQGHPVKICLRAAEGEAGDANGFAGAGIFVVIGQHHMLDSHLILRSRPDQRQTGHIALGC